MIEFLHSFSYKSNTHRPYPTLIVFLMCQTLSGFGGGQLIWAHDLFFLTSTQVSTVIWTGMFIWNLRVIIVCSKTNSFLKIDKLMGETKLFGQ